MMENIYFTTTNGTLVNNYDIAKTAIINGDYIDDNNFEEVRKYASNCKGIVREIKPSIKSACRMVRRLRQLSCIMFAILVLD